MTGGTGARDRRGTGPGPTDTTGRALPGRGPAGSAGGAATAIRDVLLPAALVILCAALVALLLSGCTGAGGTDETGAGGRADDAAHDGHEDRTRPSAPLPGSTPAAPADIVGPVRTVEVNGVRIGYRQFGTGRPLLLVMGRAGTMSMWGHALPRALAGAGFRVTMFDNRGCGHSSDDPSKPLTMQVMADDTVALADTLGLDHPVVVGWSMGGEIALTAAVRHPGRLGPIVTSGSDAGSPHYIAGDPAADAVLADPDASPVDMLRLLFPDLGSPGARAFVEGLGLYPDPPLTPQVQARQTEAEEAWFDDPSTWDGLGSIRNRVVLTNGSEDLLTVVANAGAVADRIPGARVEIFDGLGHGMLFDAVDRFAGVVVATAGGR